VEEPLSPRARKSEKAREEILAAAARAIARDGFHGMSMRKLAQDTASSLANFYNYFDSKEAVLFALHERAIETLISSATERVAASNDPVAQLYLFIVSHVGYLIEKPDVMRVLVQGHSALGSEERDAVRTLKARHFAIARDIIRRILGEQPMAEEELERVTYSIFGMMNWIYGWYDPERHGSVRDVARSMHRIALSGLNVGGHPNAADALLDAVDERFSSQRLPSLVKLAPDNS